MSNAAVIGPSPFDFPKDLNAGNARAVEIYNKEILAKYTLAVNNYNASMDIGHTYPGPVPGVPQFYKLGPPNEFGVSSPILTDEVPAGIELPKIHEKVKSDSEVRKLKGKIHIGHATHGGGGVWFTAAEDDTFPVNPDDPTPANWQTPPTTTDDGVTGIFQRVFGIGNGWYRKIG